MPPSLEVCATCRPHSASNVHSFRAGLPLPKKNLPRHTPLGALLRMVGATPRHKPCAFFIILRAHFSGGASRWQVHVAVASMVVKFGSGTLVSLLVGATPVVFQGARHMLFFVVGLCLMWLSPGDIVHDQMCRSRAIRLLIDMAQGLYKLRKARWAVDAAQHTMRGPWGFAFALLLVTCAVDGNTVTRRSMLWLERAWADTMYSSPANLGKRRITVARCANDALVGLQRLVLGTVLPLGAVTFLCWSVLELEFVRFSAERTSDVRIALLLFFLWRHGIFDDLTFIHRECQKPRSCFDSSSCMASPPCTPVFTDANLFDSTAALSDEIGMPPCETMPRRDTIPSSSASDRVVPVGFSSSDSEKKRQ